MIQTSNYTYITPEEYIEYSKSFNGAATANEHFRLLDTLRDRYCTEIVMMSPETKELLEVKFMNIWEVI